MLEAIEPGPYAIDARNLLPQETAKTPVHYTKYSHPQGDPASTYGQSASVSPADRDPAMLQGFASPPHNAPEASLRIENQLSLRVQVLGALRHAQFVCRSHFVKLV